MKKKASLFSLLFLIMIGGALGQEQQVWHHFNETSGDPLDYSGKNNYGTDVNGVTHGATGISKSNGYWGTGDAYDFSYQNDYVRVGYTNNYIDQITTTAWINPDNFYSGVGHGSGSGNQIFHARGDHGGDSFGMGVGDGGDFYVYVDGGSNGGDACQTSTSTDPINTGEWSMVTLTWDGSTVTGYLNDGDVTISCSTSAQLTIDEKFHIGMHRDGNSDPFIGTIDEPKVYTQESLTSSEVTDLYERNTIQTNSAPSIDSFKVDPKDPSINDSLSYYGNFSDPDGNFERAELDVFKDGSQVVDNSTRWTTEAEWLDIVDFDLDEAYLNGTITAFDTAGASTSQTISRYVDETPPRIQIQDPSGDLNRKKGLDLNYTVKDAKLDSSSCQYSKDGGANFSISNCGNTTVDFNTVGQHNVTVWAKDTEGNWGTDTTQFTTDYENTFEAKDNATTNLLSNFTVFATNSSESITADVTDGDWQPYTSQLPTGELNITFNKPGYVPNSKTYKVDQATEINDVISLQPAGIFIDAFDEQTSNQISNFNVTVRNSSSSQSFSQVDKLNYNYSAWTSNGYPTGDLEIVVKSSDYTQRTYRTVLDENTRVSLDSYLLKSTEGIYTSVDVVDSSGSAVNNADIMVQRLFGSTYKTVLQTETGSAGGATLFLDPDTQYKIIVSKQGLTQAEETFSPANYQYEALRILLSEPSQLNLETGWDSINTRIKPLSQDVKPDEEINATIYDAESGLNSWQVTVYNQTGGIVHQTQQFSSSSGGTTIVDLNLSSSVTRITPVIDFTKNGNSYAYKKNYLVLQPINAGEYSLYYAIQRFEASTSEIVQNMVALLFIVATGLATGKRIGNKGGGVAVLTVTGAFTLIQFLNPALFLISLVAVAASLLLR